MAPIKFEEQLKNKLENRSLSPSSDGWAKLSDRLDTEEKNSKNPWFWRIGIAAALIIMLAITFQTINSKPGNDALPTIVETDTIENTIKNLQPNLNSSKSIELAIEDKDINNEAVKEASVKDNVKPQSQIINYKSVTTKKQKVKTKLVSTKKLENLEVEAPLINKLPEIKENAVTDILKEFKTDNKTAADKEVDSLLKLANKELFKDKLQKETTKTVDANALLNSVEDEMGQSFRSKVFDALKGSYETVKTVVAERNN